MRRLDLRRETAAITLLAVFTAAGAARADCGAVHAALLKAAAAPHHAYQSETAVFTGNKPRLGEMIVTGSQMYLQVRGAWRKLPYDARQQAADIDTKFKSNPTTCVAAGMEAVNGEPATVYHITEKTPDSGSTDGRIWISVARGLPLREDSTMSDPKVQRSVRYDYANVRPPPGL